MLMKAHAYKSDNALEETLPSKSVHRKPIKPQTNTIAFTPVLSGACGPSEVVKS